MHRRMVDLQRYRATSGEKNFMERIKAPIFWEAVLTVEMRASIQFRRESQHQHLKRRFFLKNRPIHFYINSTSVIRLVKRNQLSFSSNETNKPLLATVQCLMDQIQVRNPILVVAADQMPNHT